MRKILNFFDSALDIFRKKEYYNIDYDSLNNYFVEFTELQEENLLKIQSIIEDFQEAEKLNDEKASLCESSSNIHSKIDELMIEIKKIIHEDYRETYFESSKENWNFNYFLTNSSMIYDDVLLISNRIQDKDEQLGDMIYPILAIKKYMKKFYLWNLLDKTSKSENL